MQDYRIRKPKSQPNFVLAAAACAVRRALRPFLRREGIAFVAVLQVPEGTSEYYRRAATMIVADPMPVDQDCNELAIVMSIADAAADTTVLYQRYRHGRQFVLVTESVERVPEHIRLVADLVTVLEQPSVAHFMAAARSAGIRGMTPEAAELRRQTMG